MKSVCKRVFYIFLLLLLCAALAGCGGDSAKDYQINEADFMSAMLNQVSFDCDMYQVKPDSVENFFTLEEGTTAMVFMGSGSYADHAGIFTSPDAETAAKNLEMVQTYVEDLKHSFEDYLPEEAAKIDGAVVEQKGRYVVLCITSDDGAKSFIRNYFDQSGSTGSSGEEGEDPSGEPEENSDAADSDGESSGGENAGDNTGEAAETSYPVIEKDGEVETYGYVIAVGDTAYELYSYSEKAADKYAEAINGAAESLKGEAKVYDVLIPLSSGITLPDRLYGEISSGSQKKALQSIGEKMSDDVTVVNPYENLMKHRDEYIYFRTDHHWTADGAYYAYETFCQAAGILPIPRENRESVDFEGFLGSFYKDTNESKKMKENPDTIRAYYPVSSDTALTYKTADGKSNDWQVIHDVADYGASMKYSTFIAGDNPYTVIRNRELDDDSRCVVVKESFGNALIPFLVDHYEKIYVIDYRYWQGSLEELVRVKKADDVIFLNNLSMIRSDYLVGKLAEIL